MKRREINALSLSFLDVMSCGFGAAVLFFVIITAATDQKPAQAMNSQSSEAADQRGERMRAERELARLEFDLEEAKRIRDQGSSESERLQAAIDQQTKRLSLMQDETLAQKERIEKLKADLESREQENERLSARSAEPSRDGDALAEISGDGRRQYLTGLKLGGDRVLILVDTSASMLDQTIVNIVRRRNMSLARKLEAPKWKRAVNTVAWLTARLEPKTKFQVYGFGVSAAPAVSGSDGSWLDVGDGADVRQAVASLRKTAPSGGTSLHAAFDVIDSLKPPPDNVFLIVDGLPTQARRAPSGSTVGGVTRLRNFEKAVEELDERPSINVILFPMEGDPLAAGAFWELAQITGGSFMAPSKDWP